MRVIGIIGLLGLASAMMVRAEPYHFIPGRIPLDWRGPDGNSVILDAPLGLIVVDTGRSPMHAKAILDYARERRRPVAAIINSHWHLDHTTGNEDIRRVYPRAEVYASNAINGALLGFLGRDRSQIDKRLADPKTPAGERAQYARALYRLDHPDTLRPTRPVARSARMRIAGRLLDVHLARFAATEGDVWIYDPRSRTAVVGDLVVGLVPYMDTACPDGWMRALDAIAAVPFRTLVPGHGEPMNRSGFFAWRRAYRNFLDCGRSSASEQQCALQWTSDAAQFIDSEHQKYAREAAGYYISTRLRSSKEEQEHYCKPLSAT